MNNVEIMAQNVLVAVGGFAHFYNLFDHVAPSPGVKPQLQLKTQTVAYLKICEEEAKRLK